MDAHQILGIATTASREEIDAAYREKAKRYHPDIGGDPNAFKQVQVAYEMIAAHAGSESIHAAVDRSDAADATKATAAVWRVRAKARAEERAAAIAAAERKAKQASSIAAILAAFVLVALAIVGFMPTPNGLADSRFVILIGSTLLASAVAQKLDRPAMVVLGTFLVVGGLMAAATLCVGLSQAFEYEKLVSPDPEHRTYSDDERRFQEHRLMEMGPFKMTNEFFRIGK